MIIGLISCILGILGVVGVFIGNLTFIIIGAVASLIEIFIEVRSGRQKSVLTTVIAIFIGGLVYIIMGNSFWVGALAGICFESALLGTIGTLMIIFKPRSRIDRINIFK